MLNLCFFYAGADPDWQDLPEWALTPMGWASTYISAKVFRKLHGN